MDTPRKFVITSAPPNPNGDLHLGHLAGPFLGADVLSRRLRQLGHEVRYVGYSDEHSCYVPRRAREIGSTPHETALRFGDRMEETLALGGARHDWFTRPLTSPRHTQTVQRYFSELWHKGAFEERTMPVFFCSHCAQYLYEAEVRGECQFCAAPSDGVYCEECGLPQEPGGLAAPRCTTCGQTPRTDSLRRVVFPLERYRERLFAYYDDAVRNASWRPRLRAYLGDLLSRPLPATPVSRLAGYGIPVPVPGWQGHVLDTWFSGIWGYMAATAHLTEAEGRPGLGERLWTDPSTEIVNFIGFDCSFSHAVLWPALLLACGGLTLPRHVIINEFYQLEGRKFSTSRGHAIWGGQFLRQVPADALRFHLCLTGPETEQGNFAAKEFAGTVRDVLADGLQSWAGSVLSFARADFGGRVPTEAPAPDGTMARPLRTLPGQVAAALAPESFSPRAAATALRDVIDHGARAVGHLADLRGRRGTGYGAELALHLELLATVAAAAAPIMPAFAERAWSALGLPFTDAVRQLPPAPAAGPRLLRPGQPLGGALPAMFRPVDE